jgi:hypothetical protein
MAEFKPAGRRDTFKAVLFLPAHESLGFRFFYTGY